MFQHKNPFTLAHIDTSATNNKALRTTIMRRSVQTLLATALLPLLCLGAAAGASARAPQAPAPSQAIANAGKTALPAPLQCPPQAKTDPSAVMAASKQPQPDRGVLWQLRKGDQLGYLFGTIHIGKLPWVFPGPRTAQALRDAPAIALELDPLDPSTLQTLTQALGEDSAVQRIIMRNNPKLVQHMDGLAQSLCIDATAWTQTGSTVGKLLSIGMADIERTGYSLSYGIDINLAAMARATGRPIYPIETAQEQIEAMGLDGENSLKKAATPDEISKALGDIQSGKNRQVMQELAVYWQNGDLAALETMLRTCNCMDDIDMKSAMLETRNQRMAERIPNLIQTHPKLFVAVGLLHMVGENNLLDLLRKQGVEVRQLTGKDAEPANEP